MFWKRSVTLTLLQFVRIEFLFSSQMEFHLNIYLLHLSLQFNKMSFYSSKADTSILKLNHAKYWHTNIEMGVLPPTTV